MTVAILTVLRHVIIISLPTNVIVHGTMLAISVLLVAHLIHVRCSVLRVLLAVGVGIAIWVASLRTLALVYLLGRLGLLTRYCRIRGIVATILRFLLAISWLGPTG